MIFLIFFFFFTIIIIIIIIFPRTSSARGGGGEGGGAARLFLFSFFTCSADHERDWPPCKVVFFELATNALNVRNNNNNDTIFDIVIHVHKKIDVLQTT